MAFPQLLRRTNFATFDPAITRVYQSTPHSVNKHGDFGLKNPIKRPKGPRYIKVTNLDAGKLLGSDWRSAETEARFVQIHGTGREPWRNQSELRSYDNGLLSSELLFGSRSASEQDKSSIKDDQVVENVNTMSIKQFKEYLEQTKTWRSAFLKTKLDSMSHETLRHLKMPEEKTFAYLASQQFTNSYDLSKFQSGYTRYLIESKSNQKIYSTPHVLHGLNYSRVTPASSNGNRLLFSPGRALDPFDRTPFNRGRQSLQDRSDRHSGTNKAWVVSLGGLTATSENPGGSINDTRAGTMTGVDFSRKWPEQGSGTFKVSKATLLRPPTVVEKNESKNHLKPMDTFKFNVWVQRVSESNVDKVADVGTKKFVLGEQFDHDDAPRILGSAAMVGGPRSMREPGSGHRSVKSMENQMARQKHRETNAAIQGILAKLSSLRK